MLHALLLSTWLVPWERPAAEKLACYSELNPFAYALDKKGALRPLAPGLIEDARASGDRLVLPVIVNDVVDTRGRVKEKSAEVLAVLLSDGARVPERVAGFIEALPLSRIDGVEIDFERVPPGAWPQYAEFLRRLAQGLHARGKKLAVDLEVGPLFSRDGGRATIGEAARWADAVKIMAYYQRGAWADDVGPGSSLPWVAEVARRALGVVPPEKLSVALSLAGTDWELPYPRLASVRRVKRLRYGQVLSVLAQRPGKLAWSDAEQAPFFDYDLNGAHHRLWYEDARSIAAKLEALRRAGVARAALWYLGKRGLDFNTSDRCPR